MRLATAMTVLVFTPDRFESVVRAGSPVPVLGQGVAANWPAVGSWSPSALAEAYPKVPVVLHCNDSAHGTFLDQTLTGERQSVTLSHYVSLLPTLDPRWSVREDLNFLRSNPRIASDLNFLRPLRTSWRDRPADYAALWLSPAGQVTGLHADREDMFLVQIFGQKRVSFISPTDEARVYPDDPVKVDRCSLDQAIDEQERRMLRHDVRWSQVDFFHPDTQAFPLFHGISTSECSLDPGDVLFIPRGWWHAVRSETMSVSVSLEREGPPGFSEGSPS